MIQELRSISLPAHAFQPLELSTYDVLPEDIMWVGAYEGFVDPQKIAMILHAGLQHFPHLTGCICKQTWTIVPSDRDLQLETAASDRHIKVATLESLPTQTLRNLFIPKEKTWREKKYLFGSRMIHFSNQSIIGIRVSHCVVDGTGFGLFLKTAIRSLMNKKVPTLQHERKALLEVSAPRTACIPQGYERVKDRPLLGLKRKQTLATDIFTIAVDACANKWTTQSLMDTRLHLVAWLSAEVKKAESKLTELAVWCDVRGLCQLPQNFSGNCGCFVHFPLSESKQQMQEFWKKLTSRTGFQSIAEVFSQLQAAERNGEPLVWKNDPSYLQINIIPNSIANLDFGHGKALFGTLLTRNSNGIRISITPDEQFFLVEVELPKPIQEHLLNAFDTEGLVVKKWGTDQSETFTC